MSSETAANSLGADMEALVNLMSGRCTGAVNDDSVEDAIARLLSRSLPPTTTTTATTATTLPKPSQPDKGRRSVIVQDMGYYDEDEDHTPSRPQDIRPPSSSEPKTMVESQAANNVDWDNVPLGNIGSKLMQTFGDGPDPRVEAVSVALSGTRRLLHLAIKDARALRRKMKLAFLRAKSLVTGRDHIKIHNKNKRNSTFLEIREDSAADPVAAAAVVVDTELLFQASFGGISKLSFDPPCGFDDEQLDKLFPEEMYTYRKWKRMHKAATENSTDGKKQMDVQRTAATSIEDPEDIEEEDDDEDVVVISPGNHTKTHEQQLPDTWGGYVQSRLSQFDARTEQMKDDWYLQFSEVRRGSFLPTQCMNQEEKMWEQIRKDNKPRGRLQFDLSTWETLPAQHVKFLHWLGFQPRSALPLPNEATTHALAFLAYDFFGKIVEKVRKL